MKISVSTLTMCFGNATLLLLIIVEYFALYWSLTTPLFISKPKASIREFQREEAVNRTPSGWAVLNCSFSVKLSPTPSSGSAVGN